VLELADDRLQVGPHRVAQALEAQGLCARQLQILGQRQEQYGHDVVQALSLPDQNSAREASAAPDLEVMQLRARAEEADKERVQRGLQRGAVVLRERLICAIRGCGSETARGARARAVHLRGRGRSCGPCRGRSAARPCAVLRLHPVPEEQSCPLLLWRAGELAFGS
jgi:hypothetical protein